MPFTRQDKNDTSITGLNQRKGELSNIIADVNTPPVVRYRCTLLLHRLCSTGEEKDFYTALVLAEVIKKPSKAPTDEDPEVDILAQAAAKMSKYVEKV
jgi:hypothetical protein